MLDFHEGESMTDSVEVRIACPHCQTIYKVAVDKIPVSGGEATCRKCGKKFPMRYIAAGQFKTGAERKDALRKPILKCPKCGHRQNQGGRCHDCGASMGIRIITQNSGPKKDES